jgi:hypothetical protein
MRKIFEVITFGLGPFIIFWFIVLTQSCSVSIDRSDDGKLAMMSNPVIVIGKGVISTINPLTKDSIHVEFIVLRGDNRETYTFKNVEPMGVSLCNSYEFGDTIK